MKPQYKALIVDTILKETRSKTLIFIFVATTLSIILVNAVLGIVNSQPEASAGFSLVGVDVLSINFRILNSINFIVAAIFGVSVLRSDFQNNIIYQYLTFPISRAEYFFVRVLGTWLLVMGYYAYSYLLSTILFSFSFNKIIFSINHFYSFLILGLYLLMIIFISIFFSLIMNKMGALFATFSSCMAASASYAALAGKPFAELFTDMGIFKALGVLIYFFFPRVSFLDSVSSALLVKDSTIVSVWPQIAHLILISGVYVYLAHYFVKRKDF